MKKLLLLSLFIPFTTFSQSVFEVSGPESACAGATFTLTSVNCSGTLVWSTGATSVTIAVTPTKTTTYFATCTVSGAKTISSVSPIITPAIQLTSNTGSCLEFGNTVLTAGNAPANSNFKWRKDGTEISGTNGSSFTPTQSGNYTAELIHEGEWTFQNPVPDGYTLQDVDFNSNGVGIAVGDFGTILRTTDGGDSWVKVNYSTKFDLHNVHFANANTLWICGAGNTLLRSTDGGLNWNAMSTGQYNYLLIEVFFTDVDHGWVLSNYDGVVLRTTDGGLSWQSTATGSNNLNDFFFTSNSIGWLVGCNGAVKKTTDGGVSWSNVSIPNGLTSCFQDIIFTGSTNGYIADYNKIHFTTDGGITWNTLTNLPSYVSNILSISFTNNLVGYFTSSVGVFSTTDGGTSWNYAWPNTKLRAITSSNSAAVVGIGAGGTILKKSVSNSDFSLKSSSAVSYISDMDFIDDLHGWVVGTDTPTGSGSSGFAYRTDNGGKTWKNVPLGSSANLRKVEFVDTNYGWILGYGNTINKTIDGGTTWTTYNVGSWDYYEHLQFVSSNVGWIGSYNRLLKTIDGGLTWNTIALPFGSGTSYSLFFINSDIGWMGVANGQIYKTIDGGTSWISLASGTTEFVRDIHFSDNNNGWFSANGVTKRTTDGGLTWNTKIISTNPYITFRFNFVNANEGFAASPLTLIGEGTLFYKTTDGGNNWAPSSIPLPWVFPLIDFKSSSKGWMFAGPNTIMKYTKLSQTCPSNVITLNPPPPTPQITSNISGDYLCGTSEVILSESACVSPNSLTWENGSTLRSVTLNFQNSRNIYATCKDAFGCTANSVYEVKVGPEVLVNKNLAAPYCSGSGLTLNYLGNQNPNYEWFKDDVSLGNFTSINADQAGNYVLKNNNTAFYTLQNPLPTDRLFSNIFDFGGSGLISVADDGVYLSSDNGESWNKKSDFTSIADGYFLSVNNGFILPSNSSWIYNVANGGQNSTYVSLPVYSNWREIYFSSENQGFIIGQGNILRTTNGGLNWSAISRVPTGINWQSIFFVDNLTGWVCGSNGQIIKTIDGGLNWILQSSNVSNWLTSVHFTDTNNGFIVSDNYNANQLLLTTDGGANWISVTVAQNMGFSEIGFSTNLKGFIIGDNAAFKTLDGGNTWTSISIDGLKHYVRRVKFLSTNKGFILGRNGKIIQTDNGGDYWNNFGLGIRERFNSIDFVDSSEGYVVGPNGFVGKTVDGGKNWSKVNFPETAYLNDVIFTDTDIGYTTGSNKIYKTTDGGINWTSFIISSGSPFKFYFLNSITGWCVGYGGTVLKTTNAGLTWVKQTINTTNFIKDVHFTNTVEGWVVGQNGSTFKTTDGGTSWIQTGNAGSNQLHCVRFLTSMIGFAGSDQGLFKTIDGGSSWNAETTFNLLASLPNAQVIEIFNSNELVVTSYGNITKSLDGGNTWSTFPVNFSLMKSSFVNAKLGWVLRVLESIYKYEEPLLPCTPAAITVLSSPTKPTVTSNGSEVICEGSSVTLTASGCSDVFRWSTGVTTSSIAVSPPITSSYTALCEKSNGCSTESHVGIGVVNKPILSHSFVNPCQTLNLVADNAAVNGKIEWSKDGVVIPNQSTFLSSDQLGTYTAKNDQSGSIIPLSGSFINQQLSDVSFFNNVGIAVGYNGGILKTNDGGTTWLPKKSGTTKQLYNVFMLDQNIGWAAGQVLLQTTDGGETWSKLSNSFLNKLEFLDAQNGWALSGNRIMKTTDGGITWNQVYATPNGYNLIGIDVIDSQTIIATGYQGRVLKSIDGGVTWNLLNLNTNEALYDVSFANASTGWISGESGKLFKTVDGGQNWTENFITQLQYSTIKRIKALNVNDIWANSYNSEIYKSTDGGTVWNKVGDWSSIGGSVSNFYVRGSNTATVVGSVISNTSNSGVSWKSVNGVKTNTFFQDVYFTTPTTGYTISGNTVAKTIDGGKNWETKAIGSGSLYEIQFINANIGWVIGSNKQLYKTTDAGQNWQQVGNFPAQVSNSVSLRKLYFADANNGWIIPNNGGTILRTTDGGANWTAESTGSFVSLNDIHFYSSTFGIAVGANNTVLTTTDGGQTWTSRSVGTSAFTYWESVEVIDQNTAWIVTNNSNELYKTTDGGVTWNQVSIASNSYYSIRYLQFLTPQTGFAYGNKIFKTIDGGLNWQETDLSNTGTNYFHFIDANTGYGVGSSVVKYTTQLPNCAVSEPFVFSEAKRILTNPLNDITFNPQPAGTTIVGNAAYGKIEAANKILNNGTRARYEAKSIDLKPGFLADGQTIFTAEVGGCTND